MKKLITISVGVYSAVCIGSCIYMLVNPEGYGKMLGKIAKGYVGAMGWIEEEI